VEKNNALTNVMQLINSLTLKEYARHAPQIAKLACITQEDVLLAMPISFMMSINTHA